FGGIGSASRRGILIKGANHLEALNNLKTVIFDKTGTLTRGNFAVVDIVVESGSREDILEYAAVAETYSTHPIAAAIKKAYGAQGGAKTGHSIESYEEVRGVGIKAKINGASVFVGHDRFLHDENIEHAVCVGAATTVHVVVNSKYSGYIVIADEIKPESRETVKWLEERGIKTVMLTGDNHITAENVAGLLGVSEFCADLLPHEKVEKLELYKTKYAMQGHAAFVGDGINDAPVIARADIGFAMGGVGSDAAIEAADIVLMNDSPSKVADAIKIAARTRSIVFQNIFLALGVKGVFLVFGAFGMATMWEAVFADVGVAVLAIFNSMRAMGEKI
ncbi:MAG TPA: HAD-IC family P-type ATPase, partial [Candidatus Wallbacteria bacterium]|nr:HAD-IC family P-type ATPase [Candidatus Wallbacteria bacterium]